MKLYKKLPGELKQLDRTRYLTVLKFLLIDVVYYSLDDWLDNPLDGIGRGCCHTILPPQPILM